MAWFVQWIGISALLELDPESKKVINVRISITGFLGVAIVPNSYAASYGYHSEVYSCCFPVMRQ